MDDLELILQHQEVVVRSLRSAGGPGDQLSRKRAILDGYRAVLRELGPVPDWFRQVEERVERGEI